MPAQAEITPGRIAAGAVTLGWDVGGAHLKAARIEANGSVSGVWQESCPLWRGTGYLETALGHVLAANEGIPAVRHAVTMSGEMADLFPTRRDGVRALVDLLGRHLDGSLHFYAGSAGFRDAAAAKAEPARIASANWRATAELAARRLGEGLLIDIGSTTTDIVPLRDHAPATDCADDAARLAAGELVYTGIARTPVMAISADAPVGGRWLPLMAEHFATSADVHRVLGWLPEGADLHDSADGGPKTPAGSRARLARMVGLDAETLPDAAWRELAAWFADRQLDRINRAVRLVLSRVRLDARAPLVATGAGAGLAARLAARLERPLVRFSDLAPGGARAESIDGCAPAVAAGLLLAGEPA
jgi:probable H4MPT-linked C1 transfer pathway protein